MEGCRTNWIWIKNWTAEDKDRPGLVLFRRRVTLENRPVSAHISISADTRYQFYCNGSLVEVGPSRGDGQIWYYDEPDLLPWLKEGINILAVRVLRYPTEHGKGNHGMYRTEFPGLYLTGSVIDAAGKEYRLDADESWSCTRDDGFRIVSEAEGFAPLQILENYKGQRKLFGWMKADYDDGFWQPAENYFFMNGAVSPGNLHPRTIPFLYRKKGFFRNPLIRKQEYVYDLLKEDQDRASAEEIWTRVLSGKGAITIPANAREIVELDAGEEMTGYLSLVLSGGEKAEISILQAESYFVRDRKGCPVKRQRDDRKTGFLTGFTDYFYPAGCGRPERPEKYSPFWFRTFRYVKLEIKTGDMPLTIHDFSYTETGYPLAELKKPRASDPRLDGIWEISERTLRRCMHETYEDCPYFEQLQYAMDARSESLYTYAVTGDDRLARKCMDDFKRSQRYDGMINCSYPNFGPNIIPGFGIYYILMLHDHMQWFGDSELLRDHIPVVMRILRFFHLRLDEKGYVKKIGGLNGKESKWSFIDWTPQWDATTGVPSAILHGPITMESLLYILGLERAAEIADYLDLTEQAAEWRKEAGKVQMAVRICCTGQDGMLQDGPGIEEYSQQTQVFAVLTDTVDPACGRKNLEKTLLAPEKYTQCSVAMAIYLFRALQKTGLYRWSEHYWDIWQRMIQKGATTCIEDEVEERSDCHAWGALILYELPAVILGVSPAEPGFRKIKIAPEPGYLTWAEGRVYTPLGEVWISWTLEDGGRLDYRLPEGTEAIVDRTALDKAAKLQAALEEAAQLRMAEKSVKPEQRI